MFANYKYISAWKLQTTGGLALGKGAGAFGLSLQGGVRYVDFIARGFMGGRMSSELRLKMSVTGFQISLEKSYDLIQELTGVSVAMINSEREGTPVLINEKNRTELKTTDFVGACSIVSFDFLKASAARELAKHSGSTYLFIGQNTTIVDQSPDWLERVVKNADSATLGGNYIKFNSGNGPFSNARAVSRVEINETSAAVKLENSISLYSGQIVASAMNNVRW